MLEKAMMAGMAGRIHKHVKGNGKCYAVIDGGNVINTVHWDPKEAPDWKPLRGVAVPIETAASLGICPSCGEPVIPGQPTCGEARCRADQPPLRVVPPVEPQEAPQLAPIPLAPPAPPEITPAFYSAPVQLQATNLKLTSLQDILVAADPAPIHIPAIRVPEAPQAWRARAKAEVLTAVGAVNSQLAEGRPLYEQALMARNGKVEPMAGLTLSASIQGIEVDVLVEQIIGEYDAKGRRTMYVHTLRVKALRDIDNAGTDEEAYAIARQAVKDIMGENE
jgi:hypothetical protein